jgi:hypothetical protein
MTQIYTYTETHIQHKCHSIVRHRKGKGRAEGGDDICHMREEMTFAMYGQHHEPVGSTLSGSVSMGLASTDSSNYK